MPIGLFGKLGGQQVTRNVVHGRGSPGPSKATRPDKAGGLALSGTGTPGLWRLTSDAEDIEITTARSSGQIDLATEAWVADPVLSADGRARGDTLTLDPGMAVGAPRSSELQISRDGGRSWSPIPATINDALSYDIAAGEVPGSGSNRIRAAVSTGGFTRHSNWIEVPAAGAACQRPVVFDGRQWMDLWASLGSHDDMMMAALVAPDVTARADWHTLLGGGGSGRSLCYRPFSETSAGSLWWQVADNNAAMVADTSNGQAAGVGEVGLTIMRLTPSRWSTAGWTGVDLAGAGATAVSHWVKGASASSWSFEEYTAVGALSNRDAKLGFQGRLYRLVLWGDTGSLPASMESDADAEALVPHLIDGSGLIQPRDAAHTQWGPPLIDVGLGGAEEFNAGVNHGSLGNFAHTTGGFADGDP